MNLFQSVTSALDNTLASDPTAGKMPRQTEQKDKIFNCICMSEVLLHILLKMCNVKPHVKMLTLESEEKANIKFIPKVLLLLFLSHKDLTQ